MIVHDQCLSHLILKIFIREFLDILTNISKFDNFVANNVMMNILQVLTKDSVTVAVDAVVYYRIYNPIVSVTNVENADRSTRLLAATTLRNVLGTKNLAEILSERDSISSMMQVGVAIKIVEYFCFFGLSMICVTVGDSIAK